MTILKLKIERPAYGNLSIGRHEGKIVMIKGASMPGEIVEAIKLKEKKDYITASVIKILEPSPDRIAPACEYFGRCGGCHLQHIPYGLQVKLKEEVLYDCLKRLSKIEINLSPSIVSNNPWNYRLRGQFKVHGTSLGFYKENTREVVDIDNCPLMVTGINDSFKKIRQLILSFNLKEVHLTAGNSVIAFIKPGTHNKPNAVWNRLSSGFSGMFFETGTGKILSFGNPFITLELDDLKYTISPMTFFQSNWETNRSVVNLIKSHLGSLNNKLILDLYAGAGNFTLPFAEGAEVTAVEENPYAIKDGKRNLQINNISNCKFVRSSAENFRSEKHFDLLFLDPPRPGLTNSVMEKVLSLMPDSIVYLSCNPSTFARDLKKLSLKYNIESIRLIDFFPQTYHIESLAFLQLR